MPVQSTDIEVASGNALTFSATQTWTIDQGVLLLSGTGFGVFSDFAASALSNFGSIVSENSVGVTMTGANSHIDNSWQGQIKGVKAIVLGPEGTVVNAGAIISTGSAGAAAATLGSDPAAIEAPFGGLTLHNTGDVYGNVLTAGKATDTVNNAGAILGDVLLAGGRDSFDGRGGVVHGTVDGGGGSDVLRGGSEDDTLVGGRGNDKIFGGSGDDTLIGCYGRDLLRGGSGADSFGFAAPGKVDRIADFSVSEDRIQLDRKGFAGLGKAGGLSADAFHVGRGAQDDEDRIIYNARTGILKHDANGDGQGGVTKLAKLAPGLDLSHHHFDIV